MKRKVNRARIHDLKVVIPGIGSLGVDLPPTSKTVKMEMMEGDKGIEISIDKQKATYIIPYSNVQMYFVDKE